MGNHSLNMGNIENDSLNMGNIGNHIFDHFFKSQKSRKKIYMTPYFHFSEIKSEIINKNDPHTHNLCVWMKIRTS